MLTRLPLLALVCCCFVAPVLASDDVTPQADAPQAHPAGDVPPALMVKLEDGKPVSALPIAAMNVDVDINGILAKTSITLTFENPHDRVLEGDLYFPLPQGVTVSGYAIDLDGQLVDAVIVEKNTARIVFETEQRKGIDPGLVEWVAGNNFKTRIWPIPARGKRTIRLDFITTLTGDSDVLDIPMAFRAPIKQVNVHLTARNVTAAPQVAAPWLDNFQVSPEADGGVFSGEVMLEKVQPNEALQIKLAKLPAIVTMLGQDVMQTYFVTSVTSPVIDFKLFEPKAKAIAILWDASLSRRSHDLEREYALLEKHLKNLGDIRAYVQVFRNDADHVRSFEIKDGDAAGLIAFLKSQPLDGGTDLSKVVLPATNTDLFDPKELAQRRILPVKFDYSLLFSDGQGNLNPDLPTAKHRAQIAPDADADTHASLAGSPVYILSTNPAANHPILSHIASESNGRYFNLSTLKDDAPVVAAMGKAGFGLIRVEHEPKAVADVLPAGSVKLTPGQRVAVSGRLLTEEATITLIFGVGSTELHREEITLNRKDASRDPLVCRFWAQQKIDSLLAMPDKYAVELIELGQRFGLVTPGTSLLVLETLEQHLTYGIAPHESREAMRKQYDAKIQKIQLAEINEREEHIARVAVEWEKRKARWHQKFEWPDADKIKATLAKDETRNAEAVAASEPPAPRNGTASLFGEEDTAPQEARVPTFDLAATPSSNDGRAGGVRTENETTEDLMREIPNFEEAPAFDLSNVLSEGKGGGGGGQGGGLFGDFPSAQPPTGTRDLRYTKGRQARRADISTKITAWNPDTPYLKTIRTAEGADARYAAYLEERNKPAYIANPSFYFDCAALFYEIKEPTLAARVLSNVLELELQNAALIRIVAHRLQQAGDLDDAVALFRIVKKLRPEEPQSYRDLALALDQRAAVTADSSLAFSDRVEALDLLNHVVENLWDNRFENIQQIALMEANRLASLLEKSQAGHAFENPIDERLRGLLEVDLRIVLTWDADMTDMDLWVTEPSGEKCFYSHKETQIGGTMSDDYTQGYGPEEYWLRTAMPGKYRVQTDYFGSNAQKLAGGVTLQATIIRNFGDPENETRESVSIRLSNTKENIEIATIEVAE